MTTGVPISALPAVPSAQLTDIFAVVQAGVTSKETVSQLSTLLQSILSTTFVPIAGGTMSGPLILSGDPILPLGAVTKQYADAIAAGFTVVLSCAAATTANLNATPAGAGVGATLTNAGALAAFSVDGYSASLNDRILVKNQTLSQHNGIYTVTTVGSGAVAWVLTRATDYDQAPSEIKPGTLVAVNNGTVNAITSWLETATVVTVDTDPILFSQFSFGPASFLLKANNLSDLPSIATALVNLGLGVPTGTGNVVRQTSPTLITPNLGAAIATSLQFSPSTNGIIGTTTNDSASAGFVGEYKSSLVAIGSAVSLSTGVAKTITTLSLTAGDWNLWGEVFVTGTAGAAISTVTGGVSLVNNTLNGAPADDCSITRFVASGATNWVVGTNFMPIVAVTPTRISVNGPTTVYLIGAANFTSSVSVYGKICARRVR